MRPIHPSNFCQIQPGPCNWLFAVIITLSLAGIATAQPTTRPTAAAWREQIERSIEQLDAMDFETREAAEAKLIEIGPDVKAPLKQALEYATTAEFKLRERSVIEGINKVWKYWSENGGPISGGFQATLKLAHDSYSAGSPIQLNVILCNVAPKPMQLYDLRGVDFELGDGRAVFTSDHGDARIIIHRVGEGSLPEKARAIEYTDAGGKIDFKTGGNVPIEIPLHVGVDLEPGEYKIQFIYYASSKGLLPDAFEDLKSNEVTLKILAR